MQVFYRATGNVLASITLWETALSALAAHSVCTCLSAYR